MKEGRGTIIIYSAKKNNKNQSLLLTTHLDDTEYVMNYLLINYCSDSVYNASGINREAFIAIARFVAAIHDIGKATPVFQKKINGDNLPFNHALAGAAILYKSFGVSKSICDIIAAHHGKPRNKSKDELLPVYFRKNKSSLGTDYKTWEKLFNSAVKKGGNNLDLTIEVSVKGQMLLCGLLIMADWIASNEEYFRLYGSEDDLSVKDYTIRRKEGINALSLPPVWNPEVFYMDDEIFRIRFGFNPNTVQKEAIDIANLISEPGLFFIGAPMGIGKTEASLAVAEILAAKSHCGGLYYGLPTKGTANGMLPRMISWANTVSDGMQTSFRLAHSDARNNNEYRNLSANTTDETGITVNEWLSGRHRALLSDFGIGTVDQVLMSGVLKKFIMLLHLGISGKVIVIDEVHAYDAYMTSYINALLAWSGAYQIPVILLSATMPLQKQKELFKAYTKCEDTDLPSMDGYPSIVWSDGDSVYSKDVPVTNKEKTVHIKYIKINQCIDQIKKQEESCVGIIVNSVNRSQSLYDRLKAQMPERNIVLLHSRFLPEDRAEKEERVIGLTGKKSTNDIRRGTIIIGTQVLEQSLDIDFDALYTEKCPIDLLLQRIGREFRHERADRPEEKQYCYIIEDEYSEKIARFLYTDYLIEQTDTALKNAVIRIPSDIRRLTEEVYDINKTGDSDSKIQFLTAIREMKSRAEDYLIPDPEYAEFAGLINNDAGDPQGVRYGNLGTEILLWKTDGNGDINTIDGSVKIKEYPSSSEINKLANQTVNIPSYMIDFDGTETIKEVLPDWVQTGIFKYKTIILLNQNNTCEIKGSTYSYDKTYGFRKVE